MRILAVDYGDVRTGLAVCDKNEVLASPLTVITEKNAGALAKKIALAAKENGAEAVVLGYPKNMDGSEGFRAEKCGQFKILLEKASDIPVTLWDERLSTVSAHNALSMNNVRGKKRKKIIDAVSAVIILEDYIKYRQSVGDGVLDVP
ncbi:MAG: Holliday junction resolvase RuvX [Oscillospiraceae bacterium]|nr:Holliday junction resolvase RuvX [Oscillospiraceae bacterium]